MSKFILVVVVMGKKCCVDGCKTNYSSVKNKNRTSITNSEAKYPAVFRFPIEEDERQHLVNVVGKIKANFKVTKETVICEEH